jgi:6-pyruvoyltetrahydropterin/6-carboxytetrahydropterin synthase
MDSEHKIKKDIVEIVKEFRFEAAHKLMNVPAGHKCGRLHGHSFVMEVVVKGSINNKNAWVMDFAEISNIVKPFVNKYLDHHYLNDIADLGEPTSESLVVWIYNKLKYQLPNLHEVIIHETCTSRCIYRGELEY